ncbi:MAG: hypothetical protein KDA05_08275 [Phycisphaerales bacterium]|nr:hypothetical protein [Phycisphaerales bacterium]
MATMPEQFLAQFSRPENHLAYKAIADIEKLGVSTESGRSGTERFKLEMQSAGLSGLRIGDYWVVFRSDLVPERLW